jgi:hypothetical protein
MSTAEQMTWDQTRRLRRREAARKAGRLAEEVVTAKTLTRAQKDQIVEVLRECEKELIDANL